MQHRPHVLKTGCGSELNDDWCSFLRGFALVIVSFLVNARFLCSLHFIELLPAMILDEEIHGNTFDLPREVHFFQPVQHLSIPGMRQGSFLKNALGTAAGVAGGMMLANSLSGLFSGHNNAHGIAGDTAGGTGAGAGAASSLASHDDSAIAGGIFDNKTSDRSAEPAPQQASYDDGGGWGSGGDDSSDA
jgi:hypothetical protein